jgi:putative restriction endonuclease
LFSTIAITDFDWYKFLLNEQDIGEVNFWTPSARRTFRGEPFSPFLFKLRAPHNAICGFGYFAQYSTLPDWLAWECFEVGNGCRSLKEMRQRIQQIRARIRYRQSGPLNEIGCRLIVEPTFFPQEAWVAQPRDGSARTQTTKKYDLSRGEGYRVWQECLAQAEYLSSNHMEDALVVQESQRRCGKPQEISPRLGQGTFRIAVTDAYNRGMRCDR